MNKMYGVILALALVMAFAFPGFIAYAQQADQQEVPYGPWVDEVVFFVEPDEGKAVTMLKTGDMHAYFTDISSPDVFAEIRESPELWYTMSYGLYYELTFNPVGPEFPKTGKLNPFAVPRIREAMNYLVDRDYIASELCGGMAEPRYFAITPAFPEYARIVDVAKALEAKYKYDFDKAKKIITEEMLKLGAEFINGKWYYKGEPVEIKFLIRVEDARRAIGDYVASQLEKLGFTVTRIYKTAKEAAPIWLFGDPAEGQWHIYTGGWITTLVARDEGDNFDFFYTPRGLPVPLWQAYKPSPEFDNVSYRLANKLYANMEEREQLMAKALKLSMKDSVRVWLVNQKAPWVARKDLLLTADLAGGFSACRLWPYTIRFKDRVGGQVRIGASNLLVQPWNPIAGSDWVYDTMIMQATCDQPVIPNPYNGLYLPNRVKHATVYVVKGTPVTKTLDWVDLVFVDDYIEVPTDAWYGWNATTKQIIYAPPGLKVKAKIVVEYDDRLYDVKYHDGTNMSLADIVFSFILTFDRADPASPLYDESYVPAFKAFRAVFGGFRIISENPLIIEIYTNRTYLDAEWIAADAALTFYPWSSINYAAMPWHMIAIGMLAEMDGKAAFSSDKAQSLNVEWLNYIAGPSLQILYDELEKAINEGFIPYEEVLGNYVTKDEAMARYQALKAWYEEHGHFWIGNGPFYLDRVDVIGKTVTIKAFRQYIDKADKWLIFTEPKIPTTVISGPSKVDPGKPAEFDLTVTFKGEPYPTEEIEFVKYIVLSPEGEVVLKGEAVPYADGKWKIALSEDNTSILAPGTYTIEAFTLSKLVSLPSSSEMTFTVTVESYVDMAINRLRAEMETRLSGVETTLAEQLQSIQSALATLNAAVYASLAIAVIALIIGIVAVIRRPKKA